MVRGDLVFLYEGFCYNSKLIINLKVEIPLYILSQTDCRVLKKKTKEKNDRSLKTEVNLSCEMTQKLLRGGGLVSPKIV